jgi:hypothetical protein
MIVGMVGIGRGIGEAVNASRRRGSFQPWRESVGKLKEIK